jgi:dihydroorotate dehydrogenase electron transfer subunit
MGVFEYGKNSFSFIYKVVGKGTKILSTYKPLDKLNVLIDLGNTFKYKQSFKKPLLITGGSGLGPILSLALLFNKQKIEYDLIVGFVNKTNSYYINEIKKIHPKTIFCTDDGSFGFHGSVVDAIKHHRLLNQYYYCCGSTPMLKAVASNMKSDGQVSLDAHMGCGFGACMGCSIHTKNG